MTIEREGHKIRTHVTGRNIHPCRFCGEISTALCDYPVAPGMTCDARLCERHRIKQGAEWQDIDFCPTHALITSCKARAPDDDLRGA